MDGTIGEQICFSILRPFPSGEKKVAFLLSGMKESTGCYHTSHLPMLGGKYVRRKNWKPVEC
jgi:hypothetical protein